MSVICIICKFGPRHFKVKLPKFFLYFSQNLSPFLKVTQRWSDYILFFERFIHEKQHPSPCKSPVGQGCIRRVLSLRGRPDFASRSSAVGLPLACQSGSRLQGVAPTETAESKPMLWPSSSAPALASLLRGSLITVLVHLLKDCVLGFEQKLFQEVLFFLVVTFKIVFQKCSENVPSK